MRYTFDISLSVLNHLGRNLYRNIITVIAEAISNAWDADAKNVYIDINRDEKTMAIRDDGIGMSEGDFQNKFLRIGYSKRKNGDGVSPEGRRYIGRKGIGKLALLSCADRIRVVSKKCGNETVGGVIDNSGLDRAITEDHSSYELELPGELFFPEDHGTEIFFEGITKGLVNTEDYLRKALALSFSFAIFDKDFKIFLNGELVDEKMLEDFAKKTECCWVMGEDFSMPYISMLTCETRNLKTQKIRGYIASVEKPSHLKIRGTGEKVTIDLFVNGRLREKNFLQHLSTARIVEDYVYGQIHCDFLDTEGSKDLFTSSREGVQADEPELNEVIDDFKGAFYKVIDEWDEMRRKNKQDGDPDNMIIAPKARKAQELFNATLDEMKTGHEHQGDGAPKKKNNEVEKWEQQLLQEAEYNIPSYTECFIAENLLREYIKYNDLALSPEASTEAQKWRERELVSKGVANISYPVRKTADDIYYLDMKYLSNFIDKASNATKDPALSRSADVYKPVRDAVGHTSVITSTAKQQLSTELENIKARVMKLMEDVE